MSTPARTGRAIAPQAPGRPTRPLPRTPQARTTPARTTPARTAPARTASSRTAPSRAGSTRATPSGAGGTRATPPRTGSMAAGRGAVTTGGAAAGGRATVGATALALSDLGRSPGAVGGRTRMRVLEQPRTAGRRVGFALTCTAVLGALMLGLLLLNVAISGNAFTVAELQSQRGVLREQQQSREQQLLVQGSPSSLSSRARGLGMVPAPQVIVLSPDGTGSPPAPVTPALAAVTP